MEKEARTTAIVRCGTTKGPFEAHLYREWSPNGVDRAIKLFESHFFDNSHFFRVVHGFLVQFGLSYTTDTSLQRLANSVIPDDPQLNPPIRFEEGVISYAGSGTNSRNSQMFIAYGPVSSLGKEVWETPIGKVVKGMEHVREFYGAYGDMPPWGKGPEQYKIRQLGKSYMEDEFPLMDSFKECTVITDANEIAIAENGNLANLQHVRLRQNIKHRGGKLIDNLQSSKNKFGTQETGNNFLIICFVSVFFLGAIGLSWKKWRKKEVSKSN